jgi:hypothetical protein
LCAVDGGYGRELGGGWRQRLEALPPYSCAHFISGIGVGVGAGAPFFAADATLTREIANTTAKTKVNILFICSPPLRSSRHCILILSFVNAIDLESKSN